MLLYLKRLTYLDFTFASSVLFWLGLFLLRISNWVSTDTVTDFTAKVEFVVHFFTLLVVFPLYVKISNEDRQIIKWFLLANVCLFLNDLTFYLAVYFYKNYILSNSLFTFLLGYIPYIIWISSFIIFLSKILIRNIFSLLFFFKFYYKKYIYNFIFKFI